MAEQEPVPTAKRPKRTKRGDTRERESPEVQEQRFFEEHAKRIEAHVNANPALVQVIREGHEADPKKLVRAKDYFERRHGRSSL